MRCRDSRGRRRGPGGHLQEAPKGKTPVSRFAVSSGSLPDLTHGSPGFIIFWPDYPPVLLFFTAHNIYGWQAGSTYPTVTVAFDWKRTETELLICSKII